MNIKIIGVIKKLSPIKNPKMEIPYIITTITSETIFCVLNIKLYVFITCSFTFPFIWLGSVCSYLLSSRSGCPAQDVPWEI